MQRHTSKVAKVFLSSLTGPCSASASASTLSSSRSVEQPTTTRHRLVIPHENSKNGARLKHMNDNNQDKIIRANWTYHLQGACNGTQQLRRRRHHSKQKELLIVYQHCVSDNNGRRRRSISRKEQQEKEKQQNAFMTAGMSLRRRMVYKHIFKNEKND